MSGSDPLREPILVTGATGFIGRHLMRRLLSGGAHVRALVLSGEPTPTEWEAAVEIVRGDIRDPEAAKAAAPGCQLVFHLAAVVGDWGPEELFRQVTIDGTRYLLDAAAETKARVVLASSIVVYGDRLGRSRCDEESGPGRAYGPYSRSKQAQEKMAMQLVESAGCDIRIVRPANVYGPGSRPWVDEVTKLLRAGKPTLISGGMQNAGLVYVDNVVEVMVRAAGAAAGPGDVFNACDELPVTWAHYLGDLARLVGAPPPRSVPGWLAWPLATAMEQGGRILGLESRPPLTREAVHLVSSDHDLPMDRARNQLGYRKLVNYEQGLAAVARYLSS
jgi:nucleoside-diphosphate-sugar epimerase